MISTHVAALWDVHFVVSILLANDLHSVSKFAAPLLAIRSFNVGNNVEDDYIFAVRHAVAVGFCGLGTMMVDVGEHLGSKIKLLGENVDL